MCISHINLGHYSIQHFEHVKIESVMFEIAYQVTSLNLMWEDEFYQLKVDMTSTEICTISKLSSKISRYS